MTVLAALRCDRIDAPCLLDQPINGQSFCDYVEQCLVPTLAPNTLHACLLGKAGVPGMTRGV